MNLTNVPDKVSLEIKRQSPVVCLADINFSNGGTFAGFCLVDRAYAEAMKNKTGIAPVAPLAEELKIVPSGTACSKYEAPKYEASKLMNLARLYPKTVKIFISARNESDVRTKEKLLTECYTAYLVETVSLKGKLDGPIYTLDAVIQIAAAFRRFQKRRMSFDLEEILHLISDWDRLQKLPPVERINAVRVFQGHPPYKKDSKGNFSDSALKDALRLEQWRKRLKLPSFRTPGRPKISAGIK